MHPSPLKFRKSSYSGSGDNCVEVAEIPPTFRKSSYSSGASECVEVADLPAGAAVRDTRNRESGHITFPAREMAGLLGALRSGQL